MRHRITTWTPYTCQMLKIDEKHKLPNSKYSFGITKTDKIFDVLLNEKQIFLRVCLDTNV